MYDALLAMGDSYGQEDMPEPLERRDRYLFWGNEAYNLESRNEAGMLKDTYSLMTWGVSNPGTYYKPMQAR